MFMLLYSSLLALALFVSAPVWLWRMATSDRYRAGLAGRLGRIPASLDETIQQRGAAPGLIWLHAVSVGEVLAAERLLSELQTALPSHLLVVSTTTATGQKIAQQKLSVPVFYFPLDFAFAVRRYLRVLRPTLFLTMESELWPRMIYECKSAGIPVAVVNARMSDRSFRRTKHFRNLWLKMAGKVTLFLAQSDETAHRLLELGVSPNHILTTGNLKYDSPEPRSNTTADWIRSVAKGRPIVVAGSTLPGTGDDSLDEEAMLIQAWEGSLRRNHQALLVLAPRHPERFATATVLALEFPTQTASGSYRRTDRTDVIVLDTLGDLAAVYAVADAAFIGGSLVPSGGHNPLEAARFGVPVVMGPSYENFREIVEGMRAADAIQIVQDRHELEGALIEAIQSGKAQGERGRAFFQSQAGATSRTVQALLELIP